jgi:H+-transporting ATPase
MRRLSLVSGFMGLMAVAPTFGLLVIGMEWLSNPDWQAWITLTQEQIQTVIFLQIVAGGHLLYFVMRSRQTIFSPPWPSATVFWAIVGTRIFAVLMVGFGWFVPAIPWTVIGLVWLYLLIWMIALDLVKIALYRRLRRESSRPRWYERVQQTGLTARAASR